MAAQTLQEATETATAEAVLWAAAPDPDTARALASTFAAIGEHASERPHLRELLRALARWFSGVGAGADAAGTDLAHLTDALLATVDLATGSTPFDPGSDGAAAIARVLEEADLPPSSAVVLVIDLADEARAAFADLGPASHDDAEVGASSRPHQSEHGGDLMSGDGDGAAWIHADDAAVPPATDSDGPIWLAPAERDLIVDAIHRELLPQLIDLAARPGSVGTDDGGASFLLETTANALAVVGLRACARLLGRAARAICTDTDETALADTASWLVDLTEVLTGDDPTRAALALAESSARIIATPSSGPGAAPLLHEISRLRIGIDPATRERTKREIAAGDIDLAPAADVIPSVLEDMLRELPAHADGLIDAIAAIAAGRDPDAIDRAKRIAHTLKGDANTVGIRGLANLTHAMEDIFVEVVRGGGHWPDGVLALLAEAADTTASMADHLLARGAPPENTADMLARVYAVADALERDEPLPTTALRAHTPASSEVTRAAASDAPASATTTTAEEAVTLPRSVVDRLLQLAAESIALGAQLRNALEATNESRGAVADELARATSAANLLDEQVGYRELALAEKRRNQLAVDPLELDEYNELYVVSRRVQETTADARERLRALDETSARAETLLARKLRVDDDLQSLVRRSRLVDVATYRARFERAVRQAARMVEKHVELVLHGGDARVDKLLLDALVEPLMHLLRNAVDHGIEAPARREATGKPATGRIVLTFRERSQMLEVFVEDDGAGIDFERIRERGVRLGLIDASNSDQRQLEGLLFRAGFSTRDVVTQVSGRGVGLDVVARRLQALGGRVEVGHGAGNGTRFELRIPLSIGALQVAVVPVRGHDYALATDGIVRFEPLAADAVQATASGTQARVGDAWVPAIDIGRLLGFGPALHPDRACVGAIVGDGEATGIVLCERIETLSLVVLETFGERLPPLAGLRGATVLGDGRAVPVLDIGEYWRLREGRSQWLEIEEQARERPARIVVADDSLSIRRALGDLLRDAGYEVELARDGLEALMACERETPAALLVDLEMPRMNGLELAAHLRKDTRFSAMPIVMITSRTAERHRTLAESAGVDAVLGKPYSDDDVLEMLGSHMR
jgi:chemosensory pili system protein ChpA (sensor histidine kinase/response regulator)